MGRTLRSTLLIPCLWSLHVVPGSISWHWLGSKSCFLAHTGTWSSMLPSSTGPATFTLKHEGNWCPLEARPRAPTAPRVTEGASQKAWFPCVSSSCWLCSQSLCQQAGLWAPDAHQLCSPMPAATAVAPGSLLASRTQGACYLKPWIPYACSATVQPSWSPWTGKQAPGVPLPTGFVLQWLQQLLWLLETDTW
jgi:hypothetical protein